MEIIGKAVIGGKTFRIWEDNTVEQVCKATYENEEMQGIQDISDNKALEKIVCEDKNFVGY